MKQGAADAQEQLQWLAQQGAKFALPFGRSKSDFPKDWTQQPHGIDEAIAHARSGQNVGLLTGAHSGGIIALDRDIHWAATRAMLGEEANTTFVLRDNAPDRGKLLYRCAGELPPSKAWKPKGEKHPQAELLSNGRHALIPPSMFNAGCYLLANREAGIRPATLATLNGLWFLMTGEFLTPQEAHQNERDAQHERRGYIAQAKAAWTPEAVFRHFGKVNNGTEAQHRGEVRLLGNGGLLVKDALWYCHGDTVGGDVLDAWHYCLHGSRLPRTDKRAFWDVVDDMAKAAGIAKPTPAGAGERAKHNGDAGTRNETDGASFDGGKHDYGNATFAHERSAGRFAYSDALGWLFWTGTHWGTDTAEAKVHAAMVDALQGRCAVALQKNDMDLLRAAMPSAKHTRDALFHFRHLVTIPTGTFDNEPHLLNTLSGVVDLRSGELAAHEPSNRFTYCVPTEFKPGETSELWERLLLDWFGRDLDVALYLQRAMGYTLTGESKEECLFYVHGPGRAGKGTLVNTVAGLLGAPLAQGVQFNAFTNTADAQNFRLAPLRNARMVTASESRKGERLNEALVKQVTGRDAIQAAHKYGAPFTFTPQFKLWLMSNDMPRGDVDDDAFWYRVRLFTLTKSHMGCEDNGIKDALTQKAHREGLLAWLVYGAMRYYTKGLGTPASLLQNAQNARQEQDHVFQWLTERCEVKEETETDAGELFASYSDWCEENGIDKARLSKAGLLDKLNKKGHPNRRTSKRMAGVASPVVVKVVTGVTLT